VIICGDFNFRIYSTEDDQLEQFAELLLDKPKFLIEYNEFGKLKVKSCKINSNSSCLISI
jgi:CRISPR/Cas system endoribonuclease Cas6 (RAMP superfamily)